VVRRYRGDGRYTTQAIGLADDGAQEANGTTVLDFQQAETLARKIVQAPAAAPTRITVRQAMAAYTEYLEARGKDTADLTYRVRAYVLPALGDIAVADLTAGRLRDWLKAIAATRAMKRTGRGEPQKYKPIPTDEESVRQRRSSANRIFGMLRAALNFCFQEGLVGSDAAWRQIKPFAGANAARSRYLSVAEVQRLVNACDDEFASIVRGALESGMRYGELCRLVVSDFNRDAGVLFVQRGKSGKSRHVTLTSDGIEFFNSITAGRLGHERIFVRHGGTPWGKAHQGRLMREACARAMIVPAVGFHTLRHTWASLALMGGMPMMVAARNLGHQNIRMLEAHYGHLAPSFETDAVRAHAPRYGIASAAKVVPLR
jgi:integrase